MTSAKTSTQTCMFRISACLTGSVIWPCSKAKFLLSTIPFVYQITPQVTRSLYTTIADYVDYVGYSHHRLTDLLITTNMFFKVFHKILLKSLCTAESSKTKLPNKNQNGWISSLIISWQYRPPHCRRTCVFFPVFHGLAYFCWRCGERKQLVSEQPISSVVLFNEKVP